MVWLTKEVVGGGSGPQINPRRDAAAAEGICCMAVGLVRPYHHGRPKLMMTKEYWIWVL